MLPKQMNENRANAEAARKRALEGALEAVKAGDRRTLDWLAGPEGHALACQVEGWTDPEVWERTVFAFFPKALSQSADMVAARTMVLYDQAPSVNKLGGAVNAKGNSPITAHLAAANPAALKAVTQEVYQKAVREVRQGSWDAVGYMRRGGRIAYYCLTGVEAPKKAWDRWIDDGCPGDYKP